MKQLFFILLLDIIIFTKQTNYNIYPNNTEINSSFQTSIAGHISYIRSLKILKLKN